MDVASYIEIPEGVTRQQAAERLSKVFRSGLNDGVSIPEVHSEAEDVTHHLLGCVWHTAMIVLVEASLKMPANISNRIRDNVDSVINSKLYRLALMVITRGGPIGPDDMCKH